MSNLSEALPGLYDLHGNVNHLIIIMIVGKTGTLASSTGTAQ